MFVNIRSILNHIRQQASGESLAAADGLKGEGTVDGSFLLPLFGSLFASLPSPFLSLPLQREEETKCISSPAEGEEVFCASSVVSGCFSCCANLLGVVASPTSPLFSPSFHSLFFGSFSPLHTTNDLLMTS